MELPKKSQELKEKVVEKLKLIQLDDDREAAHSDADDVLCNLLIDLGFIDVVYEYNKVEKWYA